MARSTQHDEREQALRELIDACLDLGFPEEFARVMAGELRSANAMWRMASYLRQARPSKPEEAVDEMLAIIEQRSHWVERKISEQANATVTQYYNRPRE